MAFYRERDIDIGTADLYLAIFSFAVQMSSQDKHNLTWFSLRLFIFHVAAMIDSVCAARHNSKLLDNQIRFTATIFVFFLLLLFVVELKFGDYRFQLGTNWAQITIIIIFPWGRSLFGTIRMWRAIVCGLTFCSFYLISFARVARSPLQNFLDFIHWWVSTDADYFFIFFVFFSRKKVQLQVFKRVWVRRIDYVFCIRWRWDYETISNGVAQQRGFHRMAITSHHCVPL